MTSPLKNFEKDACQAQKQHENGFEAYPAKTGLYDPANERDACGVGFVVNIKGVPSRKNVSDALSILANMEHRGATGCEENTGDGAGILTGLPHEFLVKVARKDLGVELPGPGKYAVANIFFSKNEEIRNECRQVFEELAADLKLKVLGWRAVPVDNSMIGPTALKVEPCTMQAFLTAESDISTEVLNRLCYVLRKRASHKLPQKMKSFYIVSLSPNTIVYKGQLTSYQLIEYYHDLQHPKFASHIALVHSRFSTNTFPSWTRAQPFRLLGHNGEINTLRGNKNWMRAREGMLQSAMFGNDISSLFPVIEEFGSDSEAVDNVLELQLANGERSLPEIMMMMVPEAWHNKERMDEDRRAFYEWASFVQEPWDGPALFTFSDGRYVGATLDRNGLRPARFYVMEGDTMIMGSEVGVLHTPLQKVTVKGRLEPGRMLLVDTLEHRIVDDDELKHTIASSQPFRNWLDTESIHLHTLVEDEPVNDLSPINDDDGAVLHDPRLQTFGWTGEQISMLVTPMIENGKEALGSMGNDTPLACLSNMSKPVYDYFKQLFAQVTNPPIDPFREKVVMSLRCTVGPVYNWLTTSREQCNKLVLENPILSMAELKAVVNMKRLHPGWNTTVLDATYPITDDTGVLAKELRRLCQEASQAIDKGSKVIVLSDRNVSADRVPISAILACGAVHQHLLSQKTRLRCALMVESGEVSVVHQVCVLVGFGCDAICPYLLFETMSKLRRAGKIEVASDDEIVVNYKNAIDYGVRKVMAKMGISTLQSYKGAQIFEALGLNDDVIELCFTNCASRIKGVTLDVLAAEAIARHRAAYPCARENIKESHLMPHPGELQWCEGGEEHINSPNAMAFLQDAARRGSASSYTQYVAECKKQVGKCTLRGLLELAAEPGDAIDVSEVEPATEIVRRFCTGAMSYGSISMEAHTTLAVAMNRLGGKSNTGEGGEDKARFKPLPNGDSQRSAIKQVASGRFGVTAWYLANADELQIKMAQGAKPGEGGELPGHKVSQSIADCRNSTPGVGLISPPPHHDIYSIEDLKQLIYDLKCSNPAARISVKLVSEVGVGVVAAGVAKGFADHILISGHDGGTGASSWTGIRHAGLPWELGLAETHQTLVMNDLRGRVVLQTDGQIRHGEDVIMAALLGAEEFGFATVPLLVLGCTMMRKCHLNTCPVGIATQDPVLRKRFAGQPEHVVNYFMQVAEHCRELMAKLGFRSMNEMVGRTDKLRVRKDRHGKARSLDLTPILTLASQARPDAATHNVIKQKHDLAERKDHDLIEKAQPALLSKTPVTMKLRILNTDRAFTTTLSHEIIKAHGQDGLPDHTITINVNGSAGQSLGAFMARGVHVQVTGDCNDYVGKGLSGGIISVRPNKYHGDFVAEDNVIAGNVCLYGATSGEAYFRGRVAERFCVRNSGAMAVAEGCGDHGCEYMTGGVAVILGRPGINFAAGMSGGIAYVLDEKDLMPYLLNTETAGLYPVEEKEDVDQLWECLSKHHKYTESSVAARLLSSWPASAKLFVKVYPHDYRHVLEARKKESQLANETVDSSAHSDEQISMKNEANRAAQQATPASNEPSLADLEDLQRQSLESTKSLKQRRENKVKGFMKFQRKADPYRPPLTRLEDCDELTSRLPDKEIVVQAARCMDCGVPFCQSDTGCPLGNVIPQWNNRVNNGEWKEALNRLLLTNNFPEFTGRVCPAPCEGACVLGISQPAVSIKSIECAIIDKGFKEGWIKPHVPQIRTGKSVAVIGGGPAGMAAADQLNKMGHWVTVYERQDRIGGLLMYGIPNMKLGKDVVQRRVDLLQAEGVKFIVNADVGASVNAQEIVKQSDAVVVAVGATWPRGLDVDGKDLHGIYYAMDFLRPATKSVLQRGEGLSAAAVNAKGKNVLVIGGGDTGNDCIGTAMRMGAKSVVSFEILPPPPPVRGEDNPWPQWPKVFRVDYGHSEVQARFSRDPRQYSTMTKRFQGDAKGNVIGVETIEVEWSKTAGGQWTMKEVPGTERVFEVELVLLAMGYMGPEKYLRDALNLVADKRSDIKTPTNSYETNVPKIYAAGDCRRGQSLVVWAINEGRQAARQVDLDLMGSTTLPVSGGIIPIITAAVPVAAPLC